MSKTISIIIMFALVISIGIIFFSNSISKNNTETGKAVQNSEIKDGIQYITVNAKGGYSPKMSIAKAGIPTKLIVKTNGTYDCSASLAIRSLGFQKILSQTGEEVIDLGIQKTGSTLQGLCGMGMYNFKIDFN
ncbi:MAG: cupredoxin domain-containing protein [Patescibacteria group bacterium]